MFNTQWHPYCEARKYESSGSRTSYARRWSSYSDHTTAPPSPKASRSLKKMMIAILTDPRKLKCIESTEEESAHQDTRHQAEKQQAVVQPADQQRQPKCTN